jgi:DegV family protein with EDD domain
MLGARAVGDEGVRVLDAKTAAAGQGMAAAEAARTSAAGGRLDDACDRAVWVASRMNIWATLSQLDFLRRSGRVPAVAALGADALGLQPVVRYSGASPTPVGVVRSTRKGTDRLFGAWSRTIEDGKGHAIAFHSDRPDDAAAIVRRIAERSPSTEAHVVEVTASLASHTGPGLLGLAWFWDN